MPRSPSDPTIHIGLRLFDGTDYDTTIERVAYGGFGVIAFGPNQLNPERQPMVAYKTLRRELLADAETHATFVRECLLWIGMWAHPNIAQAFAVLEMGDTAGLRPFIALAYAEQGSLRDLLIAVRRHESGGRLPLNIGLHLAQQIAVGLAYLHQPDLAYLRAKPTVHRDLKPENVLLTNGRAVITDFGLAKAVTLSPAAIALALAENGTTGVGEAEPLVGSAATRTGAVHTAAGSTMGTPTYMPAEQWLGARDVGPAADVYAFGVMLSELLAGRHALLDLEQPHTQGEWRQAHLDPHPRPLRAVEPQIPARVEALYQRCLSRDPAARPSAAEALAELQAGAQEAGVAVYTSQEIMPHTPYNELVHWHQWGNAYFRLKLYEEALTRNDRALKLARQLAQEQPHILPATLNTRGAILVKLGGAALKRAEAARARGDSAAALQAEREAAAWDTQAISAYQEALTTHAPDTTPEGQRGRATVWHQLGVFHNERRRHAAAEAAYARALTIQNNKAETFYARAINFAQWSGTDAEAGEIAAAIEHLRQARVHAITSLGLHYPPARGQVEAIEALLAELERLAE